LVEAAVGFVEFAVDADGVAAQAEDFRQGQDGADMGRGLSCSMFVRSGTLGGLSSGCKNCFSPIMALERRLRDVAAGCPTAWSGRCKLGASGAAVKDRSRVG
jgi:hypothetical protein